MLTDFRLAIRSIFKTPMFTLVVVVTLAAGVAGATAIASVARAMVYRPLQYPDVHELMMIGRGRDVANTSLNMMTFFMLRDRLSACQHIGARTGRPGINMTAGDSAEYVRNALATAGYFEALGIVPRYGRLFRIEDEEPGGPRIAIVDERLAARAFESGQNALGKPVTLGSQTYEIVGVLPPLERSAAPPDVWLPVRAPRGAQTGLNFTITCRLQDGRTLQSASAELSSLQSEYAALRGASQTTLDNDRLGLTPLSEALTRDHRPIIGMLTFAVVVVLLIACANSAWLFSARAVDQRAESALRTALGAGRWRIARKVLIESVTLALLGGAVGVVVAFWALPFLLALPPRGQAWEADMDVVVIGLAVVVAAFAGTLCGLVPALRHARLDPLEALQSGSRRLASGRDAKGARRFMVSGEVALCMVLLVTSGLLVRCLKNLQNVDVGFDPQYVLTAQVSMDDARYRNSAAVNALFDQVRERMAKTPGVDSVAVVTNIPIDRGLNLPIQPPVPIAGVPIVSVDWRYVTDNYFRAMRIPLRQGRDFNASDQTAAAPVAIVNEAFVSRYFSNGEPLGSIVELSKVAGISDPRQIVGVVANTQQQGLRSTPPTIFVPVTQVPDGLVAQVHVFFPVNWVVRSHGEVPGLEEALRTALRDADPRLPVSRVRTMEGVIDEALRETRMQAVLFSLFGIVSVLMSVTALAGSILYAVMRRRREIGVRLALGANMAGMIRSIVGENVVLVLCGIAAGVGGGLLIRETLRPFLFGVRPTDPLTYVAAGSLVFTVAALVSLVAAMPVLRIDPADTLRAE